MEDLEEIIRDSLPEEFTWCNKDDVNHCTENRHQHIPQYGESS